MILKSDGFVTLVTDVTPHWGEVENSSQKATVMALAN